MARLSRRNRGDAAKQAENTHGHHRSRELSPISAISAPTRRRPIAHLRRRNRRAISFAATAWAVTKAGRSNRVIMPGPSIAPARPGLRLTTHAGEWGGPESIRPSARPIFESRAHRPWRRRPAQDPALMETAGARTGYRSRSLPRLQCRPRAFPVTLHGASRSAKLRDAGVATSPSATDDPPFFPHQR